MGIFRPDRDSPMNRRIEDVAAGITYADYVFDDSDDDQDLVIIDTVISETDSEAGCGAAGDRCSRRKAKHNARKAVREAQKFVGLADGLNIKRNMGARKWKRLENARILASFTDASDVRYDCSDLVPEHFSAFARILSDKKCMEAWNSFIDMDEADQSAYLDHLDAVNDVTLDVRNAHLDDYDEMEVNKRKHHPAYSPQLAFDQLDRRFRRALCQRHAPMDLIDSLESTLRAHFDADNPAAWTETCDSAFRRFYIHAVAQYLALKSRSGPGRGRVKETTVFNPDPHFSPPANRITPLIRTIRNAQRQFS